MATPIIKGELTSDRKLLVMVHGRGGSGEDILSLAEYLPVESFTLVAPQAPGNTWYPLSFLAPQAQNEPSLTNSLEELDRIVDKASGKGIPFDNIYFLGFSQGACLTLEYVTRNARKWGGVVAFTGGLIGEKLNESVYQGDFAHTPFYLGSSDPDLHVPVERVRETEKILNRMNANVNVEIFDNMGHTIIQREIEGARKVLKP